MSSFVKLKCTYVSMCGRLLSNLSLLTVGTINPVTQEWMMLQQYLFDVILHFRCCRLPGERSPSSGFLSESCCWCHTLVSLATPDTWHGSMFYILCIRGKKLKLSREHRELDNIMIWWYRDSHTGGHDILHLHTNISLWRASHRESRGVISGRWLPALLWQPSLITGAPWHRVTRRGEAGTGETAASLPRYRELLDPRDRCVTSSQDASNVETWVLVLT